MWQGDVEEDLRNLDKKIEQKVPEKRNKYLTEEKTKTEIISKTESFNSQNQEKRIFDFHDFWFE